MIALAASRGFDPKFQPRESRVISVLIEEGRNKFVGDKLWEDLLIVNHSWDTFKSSELQSLHFPFQASSTHECLRICRARKFNDCRFHFAFARETLVDEQKGEIKKFTIYFYYSLLRNVLQLFFDEARFMAKPSPLWSLHALGSRCRNGASRFFFFFRFNR